MVYCRRQWYVECGVREDSRRFPGREPDVTRSTEGATQSSNQPNNQEWKFVFSFILRKQHFQSLTPFAKTILYTHTYTLITYNGRRNETIRLAKHLAYRDTR